MSPRKKPKAEAVSLDAAGLDRLSALPDDLLHAVMSFLRAWEVARTCVLSRRWRTLWASAPCVDLRVCCKARHRRLPTRLANFTNHFLLLREASAPLDALRLLSSPPRQDVPYMPYSPQYDDDGEDYSSEDVEMWIRAAINRRARFIQLSHHPRDDDLSDLDNVPLVSCHLKHLHLSECRFIRDLTVAAPNLISLRCVNPYHRAPSFEDMASLATATIVLNDSFLHDEFEERYVEPDPEVFECDSDSNDDSDADSDLSTCDEFYGDKVLGGQNVIRSLSNATSLELIADAEEVILNRELEMCPVFSNLKVLSLGEWCMAADLHPLVLFLQHAPNLERLFLKLKTEHEEIDDDIKPEGTSFACKNLTMVNIKCPKDDERVPVLEQFFVANGIAMEKISVYHRPTHQPR
uniref:F-box domain-containing protein n=1 Tax=Aegilops tauschii subsp. strangulata TaxID=200361 RepID=A0A453QM82_AEGTS